MSDELLEPLDRRSHVSLGADFDGKIVPPVGLEDASHLPALRAAFSDEGLAAHELDGIFGGNFLRVLANADLHRGFHGKQEIAEEG